jgi:hypothetical protein
VDENDEVAAYPAYPVDDNDEVAAYPAYDNDEVAAYPAYPVDDEDNVASYPVSEHQGGGTDYPMGYDDEEEDAAVAPYPTDEPYPGAEDLTYPVTDSYPIESDNNVDGAHHEDPSSYAISGVIYPPSEDMAVRGPKKVVKVDKELVTFVPSNLQNKKRKANVEPINLPVPKDAKHKKIKSTTTTKLEGERTTDDDYDKFMEEMDGL